MSCRMMLFAVTTIVWPVSAQTPADRTFYFAPTDTMQGIHEIATVVGAISDDKDVTTDTDRKTLTVKGTPAQIAIAEWLFGELDKPANQFPLAQQEPDPGVHEYRVPGSADDVVRVFYPKYAATMQDFLEVATLVRSTANIRRLFTYNAPRAIAMRGTTSEAAMAEFLVGGLDTTQQKPGTAKLEYVNPAGGDDVVRIFFLTHVGSLQSFQEVATLMRSLGDIMRLFTYNAPKAIAMRGTADQAALSEWLAGRLDIEGSAAPANTAAQVYRMSATPEDTVRVYYLQHAGTVANFQQIAQFVRTTAQIRRVFTYNAPRVLAVRGTPDQIAQADQLMSLAKQGLR